jgi:AraC family transcriptional regulator
VTTVAPEDALDLGAAPAPLDARGTHLSARAQSAAARSYAVEKVIAAMRERLDAPFLLDEMASIAYLSPYYFNRVFRQVTGVPPRRFHTALRMAAAKRLLLTTDLSVTDICLDLGYQSLGTFTTQFHELVGVSPRALRRLAGDPPCTPEELVDALEGQAGDGGTVASGRIGGPEAADERVVFVGVFAGGCPQGMPSACTARIGPGAFRLAATPGIRRHVAAVAIPVSDSPADYLVPDESDLLVASGPARVTLARDPNEARELTLRGLRATDPPVLLALPLLLARRVVARDMLQVA